MNPIKKRLIPLTISVANNNWNIIPEEEGYERYSFSADSDKVRKMLLRMKAKDGLDGVRSHRKGRYRDIIDTLEKNGKTTINVWKSKYPKNQDDLNRLLREEIMENSNRVIFNGQNFMDVVELLEGTDIQVFKNDTGKLYLAVVDEDEITIEKNDEIELREDGVHIFKPVYVISY